MAICNFCNKRETRSRRFTLPFVCSDCFENNDNFSKDIDQDNNDITFIDAAGKHISINNDTELNVINADLSTENFKDALF